MKKFLSLFDKKSKYKPSVSSEVTEEPQASGTQEQPSTSKKGGRKPGLARSEELLDGKSEDHKAVEITSRDKQLARDIWSIVEKDYEAVGIVLFTELFTSYPSYTKLFDRFKDSPNQDIFQAPRFRKHMVTALFPAIATMLYNLDHPKDLEAQLQKIGVNHKKRNLHKEDFQAIQKIIIITFKKALPQQFTKEIESSYNKILGVAFDKISLQLDPK